MGIFTRTTTTPDPMAVPAHLAEAYANAEPNPGPYMEQAAGQLAREQRSKNARGEIIITPEHRHQVYTEHFPELQARAEHLSRLTTARWAIEMGERFAEIEAATVKRDTCAVCGEVNGHIQAYTNPALTAGAGLDSSHRMCTPCRYTADRLYAEATTTPARQAAVRAALGIPAPRN